MHSALVLCSVPGRSHVWYFVLVSCEGALKDSLRPGQFSTHLQTQSASRLGIKVEYEMSQLQEACWRCQVVVGTSAMCASQGHSHFSVETRWLESELGHAAFLDHFVHFLESSFCGHKLAQGHFHRTSFRFFASSLSADSLQRGPASPTFHKLRNAAFAETVKQ